MMISSGARRSATDEEKEPTDEVMKIVSASEAYKLFGDRASRVDGTSVSDCPISPHCNPG